MKSPSDSPGKRKFRWDFPLLVICIIAYGFYLYFVKGERFDPPAPPPPPAIQAPPPPAPSSF
jgi:hypothetical protein